LQVLVLSEPPVVPAVKAKFTLPLGIFEGVVVSVTITFTLAVQLVEPSAMLQETAPTLVEVSSLVTVIVLEIPELVLSFESPP
jgi:hypothetical protein